MGRNNVWVKRGTFVYIEPIAEGDKVKAEIVKLLTTEHRKWLESDGNWPQEFSSDTLLKVDNVKKTEDNLVMIDEFGSDSDDNDDFLGPNPNTQHRRLIYQEEESSSEESSDEDST